MSAPDPPYAGASVQPRRERRVYACPCGDRFTVELVRAVAAGSDEARRLLAGELNLARCPRCQRQGPVSASVTYHDGAAGRLALMLPDSLRHRELEERARLLGRVAGDGVPAPRYAREPAVVFGLDELRAALGLPGAGGRAEVAGAGAAAREGALQRFLSRPVGPVAELVGDEVLVLAALPEDAPPWTGTPALRIQLHRLPSYPLLALTLVEEGAAGRPRALHVPLAIGRPDQRAVLRQLARRAAVTVELFDAARRPIARYLARAPLEPNVARLFVAAREALLRLPADRRDVDKARAALLAPDYDRLGRVEPELDEARGSLTGARAVRRAIAQVARWSEPAAEAYLIEIRSFPLGEWTRIRSRAVRGALALGLHARRAIVDKVLGEGGGAVPWGEVLRRQLQAFAELASGRRASDLLPDEVADNWRLLLGECQAAGVTVSTAIRALAAAPPASPAAVADARDSELLPRSTVDPDAPTAELAALLDDPALRRDAALLLCERRDPAALEALGRALPRLSRVEAGRVLPALLAAFGPAASALFVEGLRSRRSYLRQGSALALGALGPGAPEAAASARALVALLVAEPTEVWREVARALGDLGEAAIEPLGRRLTAGLPDEGRERIARALAHAAGRGARTVVQHLAGFAAQPVAGAAARALALVDEVVRGEAEVRGDAVAPEEAALAPRDQTVIRSFSRRFFEALGSDSALASLASVQSVPSVMDLEVADLDDLDVLDVVLEEIAPGGPASGAEEALPDLTDELAYDEGEGDPDATPGLAPGAEVADPLAERTEPRLQLPAESPSG